MYNYFIFEHLFVEKSSKKLSRHYILLISEHIFVKKSTQLCSEPYIVDFEDPWEPSAEISDFEFQDYVRLLTLLLLRNIAYFTSFFAYSAYLPCVAARHGQ